MKNDCQHEWIYIEHGNDFVDLELSKLIDTTNISNYQKTVFSANKFYCKKCRLILIEEPENTIIKRRSEVEKLKKELKHER